MTITTRAPGTVLGGRYRLGRMAARGGMAEVWEAHDTILERRVAVKMLHPHLADPTSRLRFQAEAVAAARLNHPNIVAVYDTLTSADDAIVMEFVDGETLASRRSSMSIEDAIAVCGYVCQALHVAHASGIVHRDIKPTNIIMADDGRVLLTDFGIAKVAEGQDHTAEGLFLGTPKYVAPEQVEGGVVDPRTDLYSLCAVLYEIVCGAPPFVAENDSATALARLQRPATEPTDHRSDIPPDIAAILRRGLSRRPEDRFASATQLRAALTSANLAERSPAPVAVEPFHKAERNWLLPVVFVVITAVALTIAGLLLGQTGTGQNLVDQARSAVGIAEVAEGPAPSTNSEAGIVEAVPFDPHGTGVPGEHNELAANATDDDFTTSWRTERYNDRAFGTKPGVGIYVTLERPARVEQLIVEGPNTDWDASVYVASDIPTSLVDWGEPVSVNEGLGQKATFPLDDVSATHVLLWITDLGDNRFVELTEIDITVAT